MIEKILDQLDDSDLYEYRPLSEWAELPILERLGWTAKRMATIGKMGFLHIRFDRGLRTNTTNLASILNALHIRQESQKAQAQMGFSWKSFIDEVKKL